MRITILIISILFSVVGFGQGWNILSDGDVHIKHSMPISANLKLSWPPSPGIISEEEVRLPLDNTKTGWYAVPLPDTTKTPKVDSMDIKVISMKEFKAYMERIDLAIKKQLDLTQVQKYEQIIKVMNSVYAEADRKRRK